MNETRIRTLAVTASLLALGGFSPIASADVMLYRGGALVGTSATLANGGSATHLASGYAGLVDTVVAASGQQAFYAMDDFTFHPAVGAVPEPQTWALMFAGLGAVAALARRCGA